MHKFDVRKTGADPADATRGLILLHGRGATAENILPLAGYFAGESWHVAAPQATGFQWYPYSFMKPASQNEPWLSSAIDYIGKVIEDISVHIAMENIYLMGFSQGACLSAEVAARSATRYGGIAVFTGGLIGERIDPGNYRGDFGGTRIYISNGDNDPHIPLARSEETFNILDSMGADARLDVFPGREHTITQDEIEKARDFIFRIT
jgi:phospholipase/carboxylesterase